MSDEAAVVVGILGLITAMIVVLVRQQRRREARLAALPEIEIPIQSVGRAALIQDLGRQARVHDFVVRAISGHATLAMQERYSSVAGEEVRAGLAKVISLAGFIRSGGERNPGGGYAGGYASADPSTAENPKAANP